MEQITQLRLGSMGLKGPHLAWLSQWSQLTAVGLPPSPAMCVEFLFLLVGRRFGVRERIINIPTESAGKPTLCAKSIYPEEWLIVIGCSDNYSFLFLAER